MSLRKALYSSACGGGLQATKGERLSARICCSGKHSANIGTHIRGDAAELMQRGGGRRVGCRSHFAG